MTEEVSGDNLKEKVDHVRTRFAPSPTGHLHIGNARTAIMNWIFTRHYKGSFILRIEDTDRDRSTEISEQAILEDLKWLNLPWDEGPDSGGKYGPYRQSERMDIYRDYLKKLGETGLIYPCYCLAEELEARRKTMLERGEQPVYDGRCQTLTQSQVLQFENEGRKPVFRFHVANHPIIFQDLVKGEVSFHGENIGDFVVARSNGMPMYNFACVVDDWLMKISHVIRGDDHVSNTPRQILLYQGFNWSPPHFAHIPMILGKDRIRLSKRHGATSVAQYRELGYLSDALVNFLSLLSWSSESGEEILSRQRLIREFELERVSKSPSIFDVEKLNWMNGLYIRNMNMIHLSSLAKPFFQKAGYPTDDKQIHAILSLMQDKLEILSQIEKKAKLFFQDEVVFENEEVVRQIESEDARKVFQCFLAETESLFEWDQEQFKEIMKKIQKKAEVKGKTLWMSVRAALTGQLHGPELPGVVKQFGLNRCRQFISRALELK